MSMTPGTGGPPPGGSGAPPGTGTAVGTGSLMEEPPGSSAVQASEEFRRLRRSFRSFAFPVTVAFCSWYLLYVLLAVYARNFMGTDVVGNVNLGFVFGVLQFVTTFLIAWAYARFARSHIDPAAAAVRARMGHSDDPADTNGHTPGDEA